ncbi:hypothetical protein C2S53_010158 [Perilla frutescens var. hirtella]|uniref:At1g61320/AtMIF1 LRR domain-containing protein n=1 Tax=Perilla frutescens var. hirtella TaxID=608512 RepID=A0AAD4IN77_PERFH|nr:hypothetical protein C2S53_010158 [Perilla frutescens var. hirtella]
MHIDSFNRNMMPYVFRELAKSLPRLRFLAFSTHHDNFDDQEGMRLMETGIESFSNLRRLELKIYSAAVETNLLALIPFLESCPQLQEFHLNLIGNSFAFYSTGAQVDSRKTAVHHLNLNKVQISRFGGTENEMKFPSYILKNAASLEQMHIIWRLKRHPIIQATQYIIARHKMMKRKLQEEARCNNAQAIFQYPQAKFGSSVLSPCTAQRASLLTGLAEHDDGSSRHHIKLRGRLA